jgi:hypothetical protein
LPLRRLTRPRIPDSECVNRSVVFERFHGLRARPANHLVVIVGVDALEVDRFLRNAQVGRDPLKGFGCRGEFGGRHLHAHRGIAVLVIDVVLTQRLSQSAGELIQGLWELTGHGGQLAKNTVKSSYAKSEVQHALGRHRADRRIGDNHLPRPSGGRAYASAFASTEIQSASESRRTRAMNLGTEDAGGQNDWVGMARIAAITVSERDATEPARTRTAQPHARLVVASELLPDPRELGGEVDLIIHPVTAQ